MKGIEQAFSILEIEITKDERTIKKAYAKQVKQYHPEEHPDMWKRVHDAYEKALLYSKNEIKHNISFQREENLNKDVVEKKETFHEEELLIEDEVVQADEIYVYKDLFQKINEVHKDLSRIEEAKNNLEQLLKYSNNSTYHDWQKYLSSPVFILSCQKEEFLKIFQEKLKKAELEESIFNLIVETMNVYEINFNEFSMLAKAILVQEIIQTCIERNKQCIEKDKKLVNFIYTFLFVIAILLFFGIKLIGRMILDGIFT